MAQDVSKMNRRWATLALEAPKMTDAAPKMAPILPKMVQDGPKIIQDGAKTAPDGPKSGRDEATMGPRWGHDGHKHVRTVGVENVQKSKISINWLPKLSKKQNQHGAKAGTQFSMVQGSQAASKIWQKSITKPICNGTPARIDFGWFLRQILLLI